MTRIDARSRALGMMHWGDSPDMNYTMRGRGGGELVWTNNEYDFPHASMLMYARTARRCYLDGALAAARHWMDVDICHFSKNPLHLGGQWTHSPNHVKNSSVSCSHQWVEGLLDYYHFTGDKTAFGAAIGIGENVLRQLDTPQFHQKGSINARETGWALRTMVALYLETYDNRWLERADWIVGHFEDWKKEYGNWLAPYTDNTTVRVVFMISIAVGSLMRYYRICPQNKKDKLKAMMIDAVDDLLENGMLDNGLFYYKELPSLQKMGGNTIVLEALTYAYEMTGNKKYLEAGLITFEYALNVSTPLGEMTATGGAVITDGPGPKLFAQSFLPMTVFYKAASECGLLT